MKIYYLFSGVDKEKGFNKEQEKYLTKDIKNNSKIVFIASTFDDFEKNDFYFNKMLSFFEKINIDFEKTNLIDNRTTKNDAKKLVSDADVIYLMGGDPYHEMKSIEEYDLKDILKEREGITIGVSAGSMNMTSNVYYLDEEKKEQIVKYNGIGIADIYIYPHLDFKDIEFLKEVFEISESKKIYALPNDSFIRIENENYEYIGNCYVIEDKTISIAPAPYTPIPHTGTIELETERLLLRRTKMSDLEEFFYIQLNPNLRRYLGSTKLGSNLEKEKKYFNEEKYNDLNYYRWTIVKKEDGKILGTIYLNMHDEKARVAGIDYWIREDEWSQGYITEASKCILDFAFQKLDLYRIESSGAKDNPGTWKVMEKIGLKYEGTRKQAFFYYYGGIQDLVLYGLTKEEYLNNQNK